MTTKEERMSLKQRHDKADHSGIDKNCSQFCNLNLNQRHQCSKGISQSFCKSNTDKRSGHTEINNFREKGKTWDKLTRSSSLKRSIIQNEAETEKDRKNWMNDKNKGPNKKSSCTLSLHIAAYENYIETQDSFVDKELKKNGTARSSKNLEQEPVVSSFNDLLELPRQQENDPTTPEVQQFTASQRLFTPNQGASSAQMQPPSSERNSRKMATIQPDTDSVASDGNEKEINLESNSDAQKEDDEKGKEGLKNRDEKDKEEDKDDSSMNDASYDSDRDYGYDYGYPQYSYQEQMDNFFYGAPDERAVDEYLDNHHNWMED